MSDEAEDTGKIKVENGTKPDADENKYKKETKKLSTWTALGNKLLMIARKGLEVRY